MPVAPASIPYRPYAICPPTNLMNPDGFFVVNMGQQYLEAIVNNTDGTALENVRVYIEGISDTGVSYNPVLLSLGRILPGASVPVRFLADFRNASPGTAMVSLIVESDGFNFRRILKKIFITRIDYDKPSKTYSVVMPQGTMRINIHSAIVGPRRQSCKEGRDPFIALIKDVTYQWLPNPPYEGIRGPFPYEDPWWKIALAILAALLLAGALLYDYFSDGSLDGGFVSVSGTFEETDPSVSCCTDVSSSATDTEDWLGRGLYASVGLAAAAAIASDGPDLHYRGQEATPPGAGELTFAETVRLKVDYVAPPNLGVRYPIRGDWQYTRTTTTGATYTFASSDQRENLHWLAGYEVDAPSVHDRSKGPLVVRARFRNPAGEFFRGPELYVSAVLVSTYGVARWFQLRDHGIEFDKEPNDGWYTGGLYLRPGRGDNQVERPGDWYLFVLAQDVNSTAQGTDAFTAAHTIGGFVLTNQLELNFNQPCQLRHDMVIRVV